MSAMTVGTMRGATGRGAPTTLPMPPMPPIPGLAPMASPPVAGPMAGFQTECEFTLPLGYVDHSGVVHKKGVMRLATAADEIMPLKDPRVVGNQAYLVVLLLSRVITKLGALPAVDTGVIERLFSVDLAYLQDFYRRVNENGHTRLPATCPSCGEQFELETSRPGGS